MIVPVFLCAFALLPPESAIMGEQESRTFLPVDKNEFSLRWPAIKDDGPGVLKLGAYLARNCEHSEEDYLSSAEQPGDAEVDVVKHPRDYRHVVHDFFGTFRAVAVGRGTVPLTNRVIVDGVVDEGSGAWRFVNWLDTNGKRHIICYTAGPNKEPKDGVVGWYSEEGTQLTTITIRFSGLQGIPARLVNKYLSEHPSSLKAEDYKGSRWLKEDVSKYIDLLRTQQGDRGLFRQVLSRLRRFDHEGFGYRELMKDKNTPTQVAEAVETLTDRMEQFIVNAEEANRTDNE